LVGKLFHKSTPNLIVKLKGKYHLLQVLANFSFDVIQILSNVKIQFKKSSFTIEKLPLVGGLDKEFNRLKELIQLPIEEPNQFKKFGIKTPTGVLIHGLPGTGKTLLVKSFIQSLKVNIFELKLQDDINILFNQAIEFSPSIILMDDIINIIQSNEKMITNLFT